MSQKKAASETNIHRLQDTFLEHLQRKRTPVTVFLVNGVKLQGVIVDFDAFCVMLEREGQQQIVYKHSITTALPAYAVDLRDETESVEQIARQRPVVVVERRGRAPRAITVESVRTRGRSPRD